MRASRTLCVELHVGISIKLVYFFVGLRLTSNVYFFMGQREYILKLFLCLSFLVIHPHISMYRVIYTFSFLLFRVFLSLSTIIITFVHSHLGEPFAEAFLSVHFDSLVCVQYKSPPQCNT